MLRIVPQAIAILLFCVSSFLMLKAAENKTAADSSFAAMPGWQPIDINETAPEIPFTAGDVHKSDSSKALLDYLADGDTLFIYLHATGCYYDDRELMFVIREGHSYWAEFESPMEVVTEGIDLDFRLQYWYRDGGSMKSHEFPPSIDLDTDKLRHGLRLRIALNDKACEMLRAFELDGLASPYTRRCTSLYHYQLHCGDNYAQFWESTCERSALGEFQSYLVSTIPDPR